MKTTIRFSMPAILFAVFSVFLTNCKDIPEISTIAVTDVTQTTATSGGIISTDDGVTITARGVCWSTSQTPTIADNKTTYRTGSGSFISSITGLTANTRYYVRAYATNSEGTGYGNAMSFITLESSIPVLSTNKITIVTDATATSGGIISSDGGVTITARGVCWSTGQNPTIADNKTTDGTGVGSFTSAMTGLTANTTYNVRAYATNSVGTAYGNVISFTTKESVIYSSYTDSRDGYVYKTVTIGNQVWMAENLRYLPSVVGPEIGSDTTPYYYVYGYNGTNVSEAKSTANYKSYGVLYNWTAACSSCPNGWHLPSDTEWSELFDKNYIRTLKEPGTTHWNSPNEATNETGFTALPGGLRYSNGVFGSIGLGAIWWSATEYNTYEAWYRCMPPYSIGNTRSIFIKESGFSVRCVKD